MNSKIKDIWDRGGDFAKYGAMGGVIGDSIFEFIEFFVIQEHFSLLFFGSIGSFMVATLLYGQNKYLKKKNIFERGLFVSGFYGFVGGVSAGIISKFMYGFNPESELLRIICWGIAGGVLGYIISTRIPNLTKFQGSLGGFVGGFIGGFFFVLIIYSLGLISNSLGNIFGRIFGSAVIGAAIGLMISITESVFREAWLEIWYNDKEKKQVTLGKDPIRIGSLNVCEVYVSGADMISYIYQMQDGIITRQDVTRKQTQNIVVGDTLQIGTMKILLCGR